MYADEFDAVQEDAENQLELLDHAGKALEDMVADYRRISTDDIRDFYDNLREVQTDTIRVLRTEYADLSNKLDEAVSSGTIREGTAEWYRMVQAINSVSEALSEAVTLANELRLEAIGDINDYYDAYEKHNQHYIDTAEHYLSDFYAQNSKSIEKWYDQERKFMEYNLRDAKDACEQIAEEIRTALNNNEFEFGSADYFKAVDMYWEALDKERQAVEDLAASYDKLFSQIEKYYETQIKYADTLKDSFDKSRYEDVSSLDDSIAIASQMVINEKEIALLLREINTLNAELDEAVANGSIQVGSVQYYDQKNNIASKQNELADLRYANSELWEEKKFNAITNELDRKIDEYKDANDKLEQNLNEYTSVSAEDISSTYDLIRTNQRAAIAEIEDQLDRLKAELADAVSSGRVQVGSTAFDELSSTIAAYEQKLYDAKQSLSGYYVAEFDSIAASYEKQLALASEAEKVAILTEMYHALAAAMSGAVSSGEVAEGSEAWYAMQIKLNSVQKQIFDTQQSAAEDAAKAAEKARQAAWDLFDYIEDRLGDVISEAEFLIELLDEYDKALDNGNLTEAGLSAAALHSYMYDVYMSQARDYADEVKNLAEEIANSPTDPDLVKRREELLGLQRDAILAAEDEKDAIVDLVEEGIDKELDSLSELIDAYEESLQSAKDLYEYQKKISEQTQDIAKIQKQLAAYSGDTSEENRARMQKLQTQLAEAQSDLQDSEYDHRLQEQQDLFDNLYSNFEDTLNARLDDVDALISEMLESIGANSELIRDTIYSAAEKVGYEISGSMDYILSGAASVEEVLNAIREEASKVIMTEAEKASYSNRTIAADIISIEQQRIDSLTNFLQQFVDQGTMTQEKMDSILTAFGEGTEQDVAALEQIIFAMVQQAELTEQQGNAIFAAIHQGIEGAQTIADMLAAVEAAQRVDTVVALVEDLKAQNADYAESLREIVETLGSGTEEEVAKTIELIGEMINSQRIDEETAQQICEALGMSAEDIANLFESLELGDKIESAEDTVENAIQENTEAEQEVGQNVADISQTVAAIQAQLNSLEATVASLQGAISSAASEISRSVGAGMSALSSTIGAVAEDLASTQDAVASLQTQTNALSETVGNVKSYNTGGAARYTGLAKLDGTPNKPEIVLDQEDSANLIELKEILAKAKRQPMSIFNAGGNVPIMPQSPKVSDMLSSLKPISMPVVNTIGDINIQIDHVEDYNDLVYQMQHDSKFERMIHDMTIGQIGGNALAKYRYNFK